MPSSKAPAEQQIPPAAPLKSEGNTDASKEEAGSAVAVDTLTNAAAPLAATESAESKPVPPPTDAKSAAFAAEPPQPAPFAIMRFSHEALRNSIKHMDAVLTVGDSAAFLKEWTDYQRALAVHMGMEDKFMFPFLDSISDNAITKAGLPGEYEHDMQLESAVTTSSKASPLDLLSLQSAFSAWKENHLHHLSHEEEIMMPLTQKTATTLGERAHLVHEKLVTPTDKVYGGEWEWYIGWVMQSLSNHGSANGQQGPAAATRMFAWGLQHASSIEQWKRYRVIAQANCNPEVWSELVQKFHLDQDGKQGDDAIAATASPVPAA